MKKNMVSKYSLSRVLVTILAVLCAVIPSCGGSGGGSGPAPVSPPYTTASPASGIYAAAQSVTLTANRSATIYYSLDGGMPSVGGANTFSGTSPITNIPVSQDTTLVQFFAIDATGYKESVKSETYVINNGTASGPGDPLNYLPLDQGNTWGMQVTFTETGYAPITYADTYAVTGEKVVKGAPAVIHTETNPDNSQIATEDHILKSSNGVVLLDYRDPADPLTSQLVPYYLYNFSLLPGSSFVAINRTGLDYGEDLDYDGKNETADIVAVVTMKGKESVTVPDGTYANCASIEIRMTVTVTITSDNERIAVAVTQTEWYAPGIGLVKSIVATTGDNYSSTQTEELAGYIVKNTEHGVLKLQLTGDAASITDSSAVVSGVYNSPSGALPTVWFEYGPTSAYGSTTAPAMQGLETGAVSIMITGLQQLTTYHYRMVTSYAGFTIYGNDRTFKTLITPNVVASDLDYPFALALDALNVYVAETNAVKKVGKTGGIVTLLASGVDTAFSLAVDAASVYWGEHYGDNAIQKIGVNGGDVTTLAAGQGNIQTIALDSSSVYWCNSGSINKVGIDGGDVSTIAGESAAALAVDSTHVYFTHPNGGLKRVGLNGGTVTDLAGGGGYHIAIDAINVYYADGGLIKKYNKSDGNIVALTSEPHGVYNIAVDATDVFWIEYDSNFSTGTLKKVSINGGDATILAARLSSSNFYGLGVDDAYVYWTEQNLGSLGWLKKVPKSY